MELSEQDYEQFLRVDYSLLHYVGVKEGLLPSDITIEELKDLDVKEKFYIKEKLYEKINYADKFVKENPYKLTEEDLEIAENFKHFKKGSFYIYSYLKNHTIFLGEGVAYGVVALSDPFRDFFGNSLPIMVQAVLLPFKGRVVYDGILQSYSIRFGGGIKQSVKAEYSKAKSKYGIVTSLPFNSNAVEDKFGDKEQLVLYMKTVASRDNHWYDIQDLLKKNPNLYPVYNYEWGRINTRKKKKELKELGLKGYHFGIFRDTIIASAKTKQAVEKQVKAMLDKEEQASIYYFKI